MSLTEETKSTVQDVTCKKSGKNSAGNSIIPELIIQSNKKTFMIKNIPNKYTKNMLLNEIRVGFSDLFDFFYLQIDPKTLCNMGYAFINFKTIEAAQDFFY